MTIIIMVILVFLYTINPWHAVAAAVAAAAAAAAVAATAAAVVASFFLKTLTMRQSFTFRAETAHNPPCALDGVRAEAEPKRPATFPSRSGPRISRAEPAHELPKPKRPTGASYLKPCCA